MKKKMWLFFTVLIIGIVGFFAWNYFGKNITSEKYVSAKTDGYSTLAEMEAASECIVRVKKEAEENISETKDGLLAYGCTMSDVRIQEVFHNTLGEAIQKDKVIKIWENEYELNGTIYHIAGYEKMKIGEEYILFLRKSTTDDCFLSLGVVFGKVPVQAEKMSTFARDHQAEIAPVVKTIEEEARKKYVK